MQATADRTITDYRKRLEVALSALPSAEAEDLSAEVESHLREAASEGRLAAYLAEIGSPDAFASQMLTERGLLPDEELVPEAPRWRRLLAAFIDGVVALAPFVVAFIVGSSLYVPADADPWSTWGVFLGVLGLTLFWTVWYLRSRTRRGGRSSAGMTLVGLRPVRVGSKVRIVRRSSLAGERLRLRGLLGSLVLVAVASLVLFPLLYELVAFQGRQAQQNIDSAIRATTFDVGEAMGTVARFGDALSQGASYGELTHLATPQALKAAATLTERGRKGELGGLIPTRVNPPKYDTTGGEFDISGATIVIDAQEQTDGSRMVRFTVRKHVTSEGGNGSYSYGTEYRIVKIGPAG